MGGSPVSSDQEAIIPLYELVGGPFDGKKIAMTKGAATPLLKVPIPTSMSKAEIFAKAMIEGSHTIPPAHVAYVRMPLICESCKSQDCASLNGARWIYLYEPQHKKMLASLGTMNKPGGGRRHAKD